MFFFFFNDTATTEIYTLSLHDALPILYIMTGTGPYNAWLDPIVISEWQEMAYHEIEEMTKRGVIRSEEHTSELQSRLHLVCRLLLEKKKTDTHSTQNSHSLSACISPS